MDGTELRTIRAYELEAYLEHMMRLDGAARAQRFAAGVDDNFVLAHCLEMVVSRTVLIGAWVDGVLRGAAEIDVDHDGRVAELSVSLEKGWRGRGLGRGLLSAAVQEARRRSILRIRLDIPSGDAALLRIAATAGFVAEGGGATVTHRLDLDPAALARSEPAPAPGRWNPFRAFARRA
ncbi:GNAT family N-acetyltransferase [Prosthecomicrobium sp. N25]|uniref:GNAT family N-acetyltransferase n=1 Tax=Prosthecomicrobium sp. N25 TaxID=3129254 RepID=UPI003077B33C